MHPTTKFPLYRLALFLTLTCAPLLRARTFTSTDGKTLDGEVVTVSKESFVIQNIKGKRITIPISKITQADKDYLETWRKANPDFKIAVTVLREAGEKLNGVNPKHNDGELKSENYHWKITVKNQSAEPVTNLKLFYLQMVEKRDYYPGKGPKTALVNKSSDSFMIPRIPPFGSVSLTTKDLKLSSINYYHETKTTIYRQKWQEDLIGINTEVYWGKRPVTQHSVGNYDELGTEKPEDWASEANE